MPPHLLLQQYEAQAAQALRAVLLAERNKVGGACSEPALKPSTTRRQSRQRSSWSWPCRIRRRPAWGSVMRVRGVHTRSARGGELHALHNLSHCAGVLAVPPHAALQPAVHRGKHHAAA